MNAFSLIDKALCFYYYNQFWCLANEEPSDHLMKWETLITLFCFEMEIIRSFKSEETG